MKKYSYSYSYSVYYFLFMWCVLIFTVVLQSMKQYKGKEGFTPKIKGIYRPYIRRIRLQIEEFTNKYNSNYFMKMLKKNGLY